jgi:hypothetical protein
MPKKFYSIRLEVPVSHPECSRVFAILAWLRKRGLESEVNEVEDSTPPEPKTYFIGSEYGKISPLRDKLMKALKELGPSKTRDLSVHLGWSYRNTSAHLGRLGKIGLAIRGPQCVWELVPLGETIPRVGEDSPLTPVVDTNGNGTLEVNYAK